MRDGMTTFSEDDVGPKRVRRVRALRWLRGAQGAVLLLVVAAVPILLAITFTGGDEPAGTTTVPEQAEVLVRSFEGSGSTSTGVFVVSANWVLKWQLDGLASDSMEISVRAASGQDTETVEQVGLGVGERAFENGGAFRLVVSSTGDWTLRVLQVANPRSE